MVKAEYDIRTDEGLERARAALQGMRERAQNLTPAWSAILDWWGEQNRLQFATEGTRWGEHWKPLARSTRRDKQRRGYPRDTLVRTHELRDQLTRRPFGVERFDAHEAVAGTKLHYAIFHQRGTRYMPRRKLVDARRVRDDGAAGRAVISWVVAGRASTDRQP